MVKYSSHPSRTRDLVMPMQTKDFVKQNIPVLNAIGTIISYLISNLNENHS